MMPILSFILIVTFSAVVRGVVFGLDLSQPISRQHADCFIQQDVKYVIPRAFKCSGTPDTAVITTYGHMKAAGIPHFGVYMFPCTKTTCESQTAQVAKLKAFLDTNNINPDSVWLDIEGIYISNKKIIWLC